MSSYVGHRVLSSNTVLSAWHSIVVYIYCSLKCASIKQKELSDEINESIMLNNFSVLNVIFNNSTIISSIKSLNLVTKHQILRRS